MTIKKRTVGILATIAGGVIAGVLTDEFTEMDVLDRIWGVIRNLGEWLAGITWVGWWAFGATVVACFFARLSWKQRRPLPESTDEYMDVIDGVRCRWTSNPFDTILYFCPNCDLRVHEHSLIATQNCGNCRHRIPPVNTDLVKRKIERQMRLRSGNVSGQVSS